MSNLHSLLAQSAHRLQAVAVQGAQTISGGISQVIQHMSTELSSFTNQDTQDSRPSIMYFDALVESTGLPAELAVDILDYAGIWISAGQTEWISSGVRPGIRRVQNGKILISQTERLSSTGARCLRKLIFRVQSKDQGWSSSGLQYHGTYQASCTWHEARVQKSGEPDRLAIQTFDHNDAIELQRNRHAGRQHEEYLIVKHVRDLDPDLGLSQGDRICLYACARFPGWTNEVVFASIELLFADRFQSQAPNYFMV